MTYYTKEFNEDEPRDEDGKWTDGGGGDDGGDSGGSGGGHDHVIITIPTDSQKSSIAASIVKLQTEAAAIEDEKRPVDITREDDRKIEAVGFISQTWNLYSGLKLSQMKDFRFAFTLDMNTKQVAAAGVVNKVNKTTAEIKYLGAIVKGSGAPLLRKLEQDATQSWKPKLFTLIANQDNRTFYERQGYTATSDEDPLEVKMQKLVSSSKEFNEDEPRDEDGKWTDGGGDGDGGSDGGGGGGGGKQTDADKMVAGFNSLPAVAKTPAGASKLFEDKLLAMAPVDMYHEAPGNVVDSMRQNGIQGGYGVFAAIGQPSGYVTSAEKTVVHFRLPKSEIRDGGVVPDMIFGMEKGLLQNDNSVLPIDISPEQHFLIERPNMVGGYVSINTENIPPSWFVDVKLEKIKMSGNIVRKTHAERVSKDLEFVLSDATPDRYDDVIDPDGWDLRNFSNNPIALFNHNSNFPIGRWENLSVKNGQLRGFLRMAPEGTSPRIDEIRKLIEADILRAVSVGFLPKESKPLAAGSFNYTKSELVETSLVSVPANPNALAVAKSMKISRETQDLIFAEYGATDQVKRRRVISDDVSFRQARQVETPNTVLWQGKQIAVERHSIGDWRGVKVYKY